MYPRMEGYAEQILGTTGAAKYYYRGDAHRKLRVACTRTKNVNIVKSLKHVEFV